MRITATHGILALWWELAGDEAMVSDGFVTFTGNWPGYLAFVHHGTVYPSLKGFCLGSSDEEAAQRLVIDLVERKAFVMAPRDAEILLMSQWPQEVVAFSFEELEAILTVLLEDDRSPTMGELAEMIEKYQKAVQELNTWLNQVSVTQEEGGGDGNGDDHP